jgi:predicted RNA-binding Zn-ribbon protein involved in translation (DUF1610 family)
MEEFGETYFDILQSSSGFFERLCKGNYHKEIKLQNMQFFAENAENQQHEDHEKALEDHEKFCPKCGSTNVIKKGKTASDLQRYQCKECGKKFI